MGVIKDWRVWVFGLLSWALPFMASIPFYNSSGELLVAQPLFKSLMVLIGGGIGVWLLVLIFRRLSPGISGALAVGILWMVINWALDYVVLVSALGMVPGLWFIDIGLRYVLIPIIATGMALTRKA